MHSNEQNARIALRIKLLRKAQRISQRSLADALAFRVFGLSPPLSLERGGSRPRNW